MLAAKAPKRQEQQLVVARRALNASSTEKFSALDKQRLSLATNAISVENVPQLDGQYILLVGGEGLGEAREDGD